MDPGLFHSYLFSVVTAQTELIPFLLEIQPGDEAMSQMTSLAFLFFYDLVHIFHAEVLAREFGMTVKTIFCLEFFLRFRLRRGGQNDATQEHYRSENAKSLFRV
jgi:hypothetical protein